MRLNQWLVRAGAAPARRKADELINQGRVLVNDKLPELGTKIGVDDVVKLDGQRQQLQDVSAQILVLNKPAGFVSSHKGQGGDETLFSLIPAQYADWKIIGRLDKDSEGLTILSNDGDLVQALGHPSAGHAKHYRVWLNRSLAEGDVWRLEAGVELEEGLSQFTKVEVHDQYVDVWLITGWNRQVRRTFEALEYRVRRLQRLEIGPYQLGDLEEGKWELRGAIR
jgi:23S rRNA pseudouridine2605 synthase